MMMTRRIFMGAGIFSAGACAGGVASTLAGRFITEGRLGTRRVVPSKSVEVSPQPGLALSLTSYQQELSKAFENGAELPESLRNMHGLNRIDGILQEPGPDIVLFGGHDSALPAMEVDDLIVVLRNAFHVDPAYDGEPGCTIDPTPGAADPWRVQLVKVFGMPASAPMAVRHVAIDYDLKKVSAGLFTPNPGIPSMYETSRLESGPCRTDLDTTKPGPRSATHRFWFTPRYPDRPRFLEDEQGIWIKKPINVQLQSEEEFLNDGRRVGGAPPQPAAVKFTEAVTRLLGTNNVADYAHLRNDFRLIEVARVMAFRKIDPGSLSYLRTGCPLRRLPTWAKVGGIRREESGEATCGSRVVEWHSSVGERMADNDHVERYRQEYRGGVEARVDVTPTDFRSDDPGMLEHFRQKLRKARPNGAPSWQIPA